MTNEDSSLTDTDNDVVQNSSSISLEPIKSLALSLSFGRLFLKLLTTHIYRSEGLSGLLDTVGKSKLPDFRFGP